MSTSVWESSELKIFRDECESLFSKTLGHINIVTGPLARNFCNLNKCLACTKNNDIFLRDDEFSREMVVHEIVHVLQGDLRENVDYNAKCDDGLFEIEANLATLSFLLGGKIKVSIPRVKNTTACWDEVGHYATVYLAYVNANAGPEIAAARALGAWIPDYVQEFAATEAAEIGLVNALDSLYKKVIKLDNPLHQIRNELITVSNIQRGLHCLTGGDQRREAIYWGKKLVSAIKSNESNLIMGLKLHAFGDAFAHANLDEPTRMYNTYDGHFKHGHLPDKTWTKRPVPMYELYFLLLSFVAQREVGKPFKTEPRQLLQAMSPILPFEQDLSKVEKFLSDYAFLKTFVAIASVIDEHTEGIITLSEETCFEFLNRLCLSKCGVRMPHSYNALKQISWFGITGQPAANQIRNIEIVRNAHAHVHARQFVEIGRFATENATPR